MPVPAVSLKIRKFRRRFGIAAPRVVVRTHLPWQVGASILALLLFLLGFASWGFMRQGRLGDLERELESIQRESVVQRDELALLRSTAGTGKNAVSIERAAQQQLLGKIAELERENSALKEDILLFERLIPVVGEDAAVRIENFRLFQESGNRYRYRLLLAFQPAKQIPEFRGALQLVVSIRVSGRDRVLTLPEKQSSAAEYQLELRHFLRRESFFELPPAAELVSVEARILQGDTLKAKRLAQL